MRAGERITSDASGKDLIDALGRLNELADKAILGRLQSGIYAATARIAPEQPSLLIPSPLWQVLEFDALGTTARGGKYEFPSLMILDLAEQPPAIRGSIEQAMIDAIEALQRDPSVFRLSRGQAPPKPPVNVLVAEAWKKLPPDVRTRAIGRAGDRASTAPAVDGLCRFIPGEKRETVRRALSDLLRDKRGKRQP